MSFLLPLAMLIALLIDRRFGEPPGWMHPVVGMGHFLNLFGGRLQTLSPAFAFVGGVFAWLLGAMLVAAVAIVFETQLILALMPWSSVPGLLLCAALLGLLLKPLMSWRMLVDEVMAVDAALARSVEDGRQQLARLVSRDTSSLSETEVREAAIETLAENLNDSVVAPLFWFAIAGLPGAAVYRFANTADAMWGYHGRWEWTGKWAARADDLLSWIPARITAIAMAGISFRLLREAGRTPSPNSGWPMAAMALRLNVKLGKTGVYVLNEQGVAAASPHLLEAKAISSQVVLICTAVLAFAAWALR